MRKRGNRGSANKEQGAPARVTKVAAELREMGLRAWRETYGLSQQELAYAASISLSTLRRYEHLGGWPLSLDATDEVCKYVMERP